VGPAFFLRRASRSSWAADPELNSLAVAAAEDRTAAGRFLTRSANQVRNACSYPPVSSVRSHADRRVRFARFRSPPSPRWRSLVAGGEPTAAGVLVYCSGAGSWLAFCGSRDSRIQHLDAFAPRRVGRPSSSHSHSSSSDAVLRGSSPRPARAVRQRPDSLAGHSFGPCVCTSPGWPFTDAGPTADLPQLSRPRIVLMGTIQPRRAHPWPPLLMGVSPCPPAGELITPVNVDPGPGRAWVLGSSPVGSQ